MHCECKHSDSNLDKIPTPMQDTQSASSLVSEGLNVLSVAYFILVSVAYDKWSLAVYCSVLTVVCEIW